MRLRGKRLDHTGALGRGEATDSGGFAARAERAGFAS